MINSVSGKKPCKMVLLGVGYGSILYFRIKGQNHLYSWDTKQIFLEENFMLVRKSKDCRTITHVDVDSQGVLWILESNIQDFIMNQVGNYGPSMMLTPVVETSVPMLRESDAKDDSFKWTLRFIRLFEVFVCFWLHCFCWIYVFVWICFIHETRLEVLVHIPRAS